MGMCGLFTRTWKIPDACVAATRVGAVRVAEGVSDRSGSALLAARPTELASITGRATWPVNNPLRVNDRAVVYGLVVPAGPPKASARRCPMGLPASLNPPAVEELPVLGAFHYEYRGAV